jgi:hypothetical protein
VNLHPLRGGMGRGSARRLRVDSALRRRLSLQEHITGFGYAASIFLRSWRSLRLRIGRTACARRNSISLFRDRRSRAASLAKRALRVAGIRINSRSWRLVICLDIMFPVAIDGLGGRSHSDNIVISPSEAKVIGRPECRLCATSNFRASVSYELN